MICTSTPDHVELNPPAKKPYVMEKRASSAVDACGYAADDVEDTDRPQKRRTESAEPTDERSMIFVTANRSQSAPSAIPPNTAVALNSATSIVPVVCGKPIALVEYDGRYVVGRKYPKLWMTLPAWRVQKGRCLRKLRSSLRADVADAGGIRGLTNGSARTVEASYP